MKLHKTNDNRYMFYCLGCERCHAFNDRWTFNGDYKKPTVSPSLLVTIPDYGNPDGICHSFITDGKIQYLTDCTHELAGMTMELLDEDEWFE